MAVKPRMNSDTKQKIQQAIDSDKAEGSVNHVVDFYLENKDLHKWRGGFQMLNAMYGYDDINERLNDKP